ncbi:MAG: NlpC/P60 family protein [Lachnospiraceae bacterium]|nr:NlpC/P60 family protein [Lachnospiraceae bacterium]
MNEEYYAREESKRAARRAEESQDKDPKQRAHADKLKNEASASESYRKKLRHKRKDNNLTKEEAKKLKKMKTQGRKKIYAETALAAKAHQTIIQNEDHNSGTDALDSGMQLTETGVRNVRESLHNRKAKNYSQKLHNRNEHQYSVQRAKGAKEAKTAEEGSNILSKAAQKKAIKKEITEHTFKQQAKEATNTFGNVSKRFTDKAEDLVGRMVEYVTEFLQEHPELLLILAVILIIVVVISGSLTSCSMMMGGTSNITIGTSFTAQDSDILAVDRDYTQFETDLHNTLDQVPQDHPGYDEYRYTLAEIGHNPFQLAAVLTVLYEDYTRAEVQAKIQSIYQSQYTLTFQTIVEVRTRTETRTGHRTVHHTDGTTSSESYTYELEVEYNYYILQTTLVNNTLDTVIRGLGLTADQMQRYELLLETYGNKAGLFGDDIYSEVNPGDYQDYDIPPEALTDQRFANMIREAEKYLGYPYVWGGSSPSTSFDCSGFVSYVLNHCGNGWSMGRQTANGLRGKCTAVSPSEARPGDLIFFQGTYATSGASHVGIYVGNGMMIHCGNPIQYASVNTTYWQNHFMCYGRIN